jgi:putative DNA primase/helicase
MSTTATAMTAQRYVELGFSVIPINANKQPMVSWKPFQERIPSETELGKMFSASSGRLAVITGKVSGGLEVIDVDVKYDNKGSLWREYAGTIKSHDAELFSRLVIARTANRGYHLYYRCPTIERNKKLARRAATEEEANKGERVKVLIETRGEGGYVASAPTDGYEFIQGDLSSVRSITAEQRGLLYAIARSFDEVSKTDGGTAGESRINTPLDDFNARGDVPAILERHGWIPTGQSGDRQHFRRPGGADDHSSGNYHTSLRKFYVFSTSTEFEADRAYSPAEVYATLECEGSLSAAARQLAREGYGKTGKQARDGLVGEQQDTELAAWAEGDLLPLPDDFLPVPVFDPCLLPESLRPAVLDLADRMQAPVEYVAGPLIVGASAIIGNRFRIAPKRHDDWTVTPNLWGMIVGNPGRLKTPAMQAALDPIKKCESAAREAFDSYKKSREFDQVEIDARREGIKKRIKEAVAKDSDTADLRVQYESLEDLEAATPPTYIVNDVTVEKLGVLLNRNPRGLMLFRDELISFFRHLDQEENAQAKGFLMQCWNGYGEYKFDRISRGETTIENLTLSLLGGVQPGPLAAYLRKAINNRESDDGFPQRLQITFFPDAQPWVLVDRTPNVRAMETARRCFARLDALCGGDPFVLRFDDHAQQFFYEWWTDLENEIESGALEHPALIAHFAKYRSLMPSLALIFHLFDLAATGDFEVLLQTGLPGVSEDAARKAAAWCELLGEHAKRVYGMAIRAETAGARSILRKITAGKLKPIFTARDIYRQGWSGLTTSQDCTGPLQTLVDFRYIFPLKAKPGDKGGPGTTKYLAHPSLFPERQEEK